MADRRRTLKWILTGIVLLCLAALVVVFILLRRHQGEPVPLPPAATRALLSLAGLHQTATKDGKLQWELDAESAELEAQNGRMILKSPQVLFYMEDGGKVRLTADKGVVDTRTHDMEVNGRVELRSDRHLLTTEAMAYRHESRMLHADAPVSIAGDAFDLRADRMIYNLESNTTVFEGLVKGKLRTDASF